MPGDHPSIPHHWWGRYVTKMSEFGEEYSTANRWGNEVVDRSTGQKVWEPMPLVRAPESVYLSTRELECICCLWGTIKMRVCTLMRRS